MTAASAAVPQRDAALGGFRRRPTPAASCTKYAEPACTFNDDMQGTAAVVLAATFSAVRAAGSRLRDQRVVIYGAGTAGLGIADMMRDTDDPRRPLPAGGDPPVLSVGRHGPAHRRRPRPARLPTALRPRPRRGRRLGARPATGGPIGLAEVVCRVRPTILIGTSTHAGAFTEAIVKDMAAHTDRPIIMPLSNPTSQVRGAARGPASPGPTAGSSPPPAAPSIRSPTTIGPTRSRSPTTRSSSPASAWASPLPGPAGSPTG